MIIQDFLTEIKYDQQEIIQMDDFESLFKFQEYFDYASTFITFDYMNQENFKEKVF
jgi:hypothetical protein